MEEILSDWVDDLTGKEVPRPECPTGNYGTNTANDVYIVPNDEEIALVQVFRSLQGTGDAQRWVRSKPTEAKIINHDYEVRLNQRHLNYTVRFTPLRDANPDELEVVVSQISEKLRSDFPSFTDF